MSSTEYTQCRYPHKDLIDLDDSTIEFRSAYAKSPLTGAGFSITPIGILNKNTGKRMQYGDIAGYCISINVPACLIGHNRILVNSVYKASIASISLLKYWLALNGCSRFGINKISLENSELNDTTPTFLFPKNNNALAKKGLDDLTSHAKAVINRKHKDVGKGAQPAFTYPFEPEVDQPYTLYIKQREFSIRAYIKQSNQENAFLLPIENEKLELEVQSISETLLRVENSVHGKWLRENNLSSPLAWKNNTDAYVLVFNELRRILRLDLGMRTKILKKTTVSTLPLSERNKRILLCHIDKNNVLEHSELRQEADVKKKMAMYYAAHDCIWDAVKIDIYIPYEVQIHQVKENLSGLLVYQGEYQPAEHLKMYVFCRESVDEAINTVDKMIESVLKGEPDAIPRPPTRAPKVQLATPPQNSERGRGISGVPVQQAFNSGDYWEDDTSLL